MVEVNDMFYREIYTTVIIIVKININHYKSNKRADCSLKRQIGDFGEITRKIKNLRRATFRQMSTWNFLDFNNNPTASFILNYTEVSLINLFLL